MLWKDMRNITPPALELYGNCTVFSYPNMPKTMILVMYSSKEVLSTGAISVTEHPLILDINNFI